MSQMARVNRKFRCPKCDHWDWCLIGKSVVICMRVQSPRKHTFKDGSYGWIHPIGDKSVSRPHPRMNNPNTYNPDMVGSWKRMSEATTLESVLAHANELGVSVESLCNIGCARSSKYVWAFPMFSEGRMLVGIRLRNSKTGDKIAVKGSHNGLFIPQDGCQDTLFAVEGPTDTAAALTIGLYAIGRPQSNGGILLLAEAVRLRKAIKRVVIVADADNDIIRKDGTHWNPGIDGAIATQAHMPVPSCILSLPAKDMRQFVNNGGTKEMIEALLKNCVWRKPNYEAREQNTNISR